MPTSLIVIAKNYSPDVLLIFSTSLVALCFALVIMVLEFREVKIRQLAWITTFFDVSIVTIALGVFVFVDNPLVITNSLLLWQVYIVAIFISVIRLDYRLTLFAGLLAMLQYYLLVSYVVDKYDLVNSAMSSASYGSFKWVVQIGRLFLMAALTAIAIGFVIRSRKLVIFSGKDNLTGLKNRLYFEHALKTLITDTRYKSRKISLAFIDLDFFKQVNDQYGHEKGDKVLQAISEVFLKHARAKDVVARWGGEEFVLLMPNTPIIHAQLTVEAIMDELAKGVQVDEDLQMPIHFSCGLAQYPNDAAGVEQLINIADSRLLQAKGNGRAQIVLN